MKSDIEKKDSDIEVSLIVPVYNNSAFLKETLTSIQQQSFENFEAIVVNDGSTDNSGTIIDSFVQMDKRFHRIDQQNKGVSAARNAGIKAAKGKYIGFVDGDDLLPKGALQALNNISRNHLHCDLIIGGIERRDGFKKNVNKRTKKLAEKRMIGKDDLDLVHGLSLCNKWFLREIIEKHKLKLEPFRHLEDGVFLYSFLKYAEYIRVCPEVVYTYCKRIPALGSSVTQAVSAELLEDAIKAYQTIKSLTEDYSQDFQKELAYRILNATLIGDYYRRIWQLEDKGARYLLENIKLLWDQITQEQQKKIVRMDRDLYLEKGFRSKEEIIKDPLISFIITSHVRKNCIPALLKSIYGQATSNFTVIAEEAIRETIPEFYQTMPNLEFCKDHTDQASYLNNAVNQSRAELILIIDHDCVLEHDMIKEVYKDFQKEPVGCISVKMAGLKGQKATKLKLMEIPFNRNRINDVFGNEDRLDSFLANKVIRKKLLQRISFHFSNNEAEDAAAICTRLDYRRKSNTNLFFLGSEDEFLSHAVDLSEDLKKNCKSLLENKRQSFFKRASRKLSRMLGMKTNEKPSYALGILDYYFNEPVVGKQILLEGLGKQAKGSMLYIIEELEKKTYERFQIYLSVTEETMGEARQLLNEKGFYGVNLVVAGSNEYRKILSTAEYLVNEVYFPNYWIKKREQKYINIWHGTPLKKLGAGKSGGIIHNDGPAQKNFISADYLLFPNSFTRKHLLEDCYVDELVKGRALMLGYPRTGAILDEGKRTLVREKLAPGKEQLMAFMPTYRGEDQQEKQTRGIKMLLDSLDKQLTDQQIVYVNLHHKMNACIEYDLYKHIRKFPKGFDTYEVLCAVDCLCTDYSSLMFDFAVTGRKIILYCPDLEEYITSRGIYLDIRELPFPKTEKPEELMREFNREKNYDDCYFLRTFCNYDDEANAKRFCQSMFLNDTSGVCIEELAPSDANFILLYSDGWQEGAATDFMYEMADKGRLKDKIYLSYKESQVNNSLESAYPLLRYFRSLGTKGKQLFTGEQKQIYRSYRDGKIEFTAAIEKLQSAYETEQLRIYDKASFSAAILYDTIDADKILAFSNFTGCKRYLFLQESLVELLEEQNQYLKDAVRYFSQNGDGVYALSEDLAKRGKDFVTGEVITVPEIKAFEKLLKEALLNRKS